MASDEAEKKNNLLYNHVFKIGDTSFIVNNPFIEGLPCEIEPITDYLYYALTI